MRREFLYENRDNKILDKMRGSFKRFARSNKKMGFLIKKAGYLDKRVLRVKLKMLRRGE